MTEKEFEEKMKKLKEMETEIKELQQQYPYILKSPTPRIKFKRIKKDK